jgi:hypothetical protein
MSNLWSAVTSFFSIFPFPVGQNDFDVAFRRLTQAEMGNSLP